MNKLTLFLLSMGVASPTFASTSETFNSSLNLGCPQSSFRYFACTVDLSKSPRQKKIFGTKLSVCEKHLVTNIPDGAIKIVTVSQNALFSAAGYMSGFTALGTKEAGVEFEFRLDSTETGRLLTNDLSNLILNEFPLICVPK